MDRVKYLLLAVGVTFVAMVVLWRDGIKKALSGPPKQEPPALPPEAPTPEVLADKEAVLTDVEAVTKQAQADLATDTVEVANEIVKRRRGRPRKTETAPVPAPPSRSGRAGRKPAPGRRKR